MDDDAAGGFRKLPWGCQVKTNDDEEQLGRLDLTLLVALNVDSGNLVVKLSTADSAVIPPI